jgi:hypothetical protein
MTISKVWLQKQFQSSGIQTESAALKLLAERMQEMPSNSEELLGSLLDDIETRALMIRFDCLQSTNYMYV